VEGDYLVSKFGGLEVAWTPDLDGGGRAFGQDYIPLVQHLFGRVRTVAEFCAGPGFIGFSLLAHGCCERLVLVDVNPRALDAVRETVRRNGLGDRVTWHLSNGLDDVPDTERWDLVVANPPHFPAPVAEQVSMITDDLGWALHAAFYARVGGFLAAGGSVLLQENSEGSVPEDFLPMIAAGGLDHAGTLWFGGGQGGPGFYYLWSRASLPGLVLAAGGRNAGARDAEVSLGAADQTGPVELTPDGPWALRVRNLTGAAVRPRLVDDAGHEQFWLPFAEVAAGEAGEWPRMLLRTGGYRVHDEVGGAILARIRVS